jgi:glycosyltransferase involved in cell wall biosynthesis
MGQGNLIIANGTPENIETLGGTGLLYSLNEACDLARIMQDVVDFPSKYDALKNAALDRARAEYSWDTVVSQYERLFMHLIRSQHR